MRVNARLDLQQSQKLEQLKKSTDLSVSEIVKQAIDMIYAQQTAEPKKKLAALLSSDFIGCGQGPEALSVNYKNDLAQSLSQKL